MCGIAGYSLSPDSSVERTLAAQALLAGIAERGADAVGYAHRGSGASVTVHKRRSGASALLDEVHVPSASTQVLVHVRDYTKGHPTIEANNHPIRHGSVVGIHNGIILNDEEIFARYGFERAHPDMTVDSEAIFALAEHAEGSPEALEELHGAMATAWLDERNASVLFLARAVGRPLWIGTAGHELFFASTRDALYLVEQTIRLTLRKREVDEGTLLRVEDGRITGNDRFKPDRSYVEETILPSVRAPHEGASCLQRLRAITLAARPN
jgi:glucosamine 6-phosphate synthetase-like amidotransferase/phosphosugar isomerase protein